jgi:hypothetical protein
MRAHRHDPKLNLVRPVHLRRVSQFSYVPSN